MADQSPTSASHVLDFLRKRKHQERQSGAAGQTPGSRSRIPKRGMLKRSDGKSSNRAADARGRILRRPVIQDRAESQAEPKTRPTTARRPAAKREFVDPGAERMRMEQAQERRRREEEEKRKRLEAEKEQEKEAQQKILIEKRKAERIAAQKKAKAERLRKKKEAQLRKAEEERKRLEKEAEMKRLKEERLKKEKELELKRREEEKIRREQERKRIFAKIESCRGKLNESEQALAQKIADEMVSRNVEWRGYISLHSGIGGAMQR